MESVGIKEALVVDDNKANRSLLKLLLERDGYKVVEAENGQQAVQLFAAKPSSIVFMDLMMPVMDGIEACKHIKSLCGPNFVPVIFVTAVSEEDKLSECIDAGGDDFIAKPVDLRVLNARLRSMERLNKLYDEYAVMVAQSQRDQEIAQDVFNSLMAAEHQAVDPIKTLSKPAETFSGDLFLSVFSPSGDLHVMLADFTGHGLGAALGAIPAAEVFRAMIAKGFSSTKTIFAINNKLHSVLPTGMFMAMQYVIFRKDLDYVSICNCGMPDIIIRDGQSNNIKLNYSSNHFPLGISANIDFHQYFEHIPVKHNDKVVLFTDGLIEAINVSGQNFGQDRLEQILSQQNIDIVREDVQRALRQFCQGAVQLDDISLVEIPCVSELFENSCKAKIGSEDVLLALSNVERKSAGWEYKLVLEGKQLVKVNPIPMIINQLQELEPLGNNHQSLFTVLTELYVNALDHGVLTMDSSLKSTPEGFAAYFTEREQKLAVLDYGRVCIKLKGSRLGNQRQVTIKIEDSGRGFDISEVLNRSRELNALALSGRGLILVQELCQSINFEKPGNKIEVVYAWTE